MFERIASEIASGRIADDVFFCGDFFCGDAPP
jgi:hypothetical protein